MSKKKKKGRISESRETASYVKKDLKRSALLSATAIGVEILLYLIYG